MRESKKEGEREWKSEREKKRERVSEGGRLTFYLVLVPLTFYFCTSGQ